MDFVASKKYEPLSTHALLVHQQFCLSAQSLGWPVTRYVALEPDQWASVAKYWGAKLQGHAICNRFTGFFFLI